MKRNTGYRPDFTTSILASVISASLFPSAGRAEVVFDGSLGPGGELFGDMIVTEEHGTRAGGNLFHSFLELNINPGESLTFTSDFAGATNNVISRVTGFNSSLIDGAVISEIPGASLWLINPNGLVFGPDAFIDVQGSFHASTADYVLLEDGGRFGADISVPGNTVLTMANPTSFGFVGNDVAPISVDGSGLFVPYGERLEFVGGEINFHNALMAADGGMLGIAAVAGPGEVSRDEGGYTSAAARADVSLSGTYAFANGEGGGAVFIRGGQLVMEQSVLEAQTFGVEDGAGIVIDADGVTLTNTSYLVGSTYGDGRGNDIGIEVSGSVLVNEGSWIDNRVWGSGDGGDITITAGESITLDGFNEWGETSRIAGATWGNGNGSSMLFEAPIITVSNGAFLWNSTRADGSAGPITLSATESVNFVGTDAGGFSGGIYANSTQWGNSSDVTINTHDFNQLDAAYVIISTYGPAAGGTLTVNASGDVTFGGVGLLNDPVMTWTGSRGTGPSGSVTINAANMYVHDGASVATYAPGPSDAGPITLNIDGLLEVSGQAQDDFGGLYQTVVDATARDGNGGLVTIRANDVSLVDGGIVVTTSFGLGSAGPVDIEAVTFESSGTTHGLTYPDGSTAWWASGIWAISEFEDGGNGGNINIRADEITIGRGGGIHTFSNSRASGSISLEANRQIIIGGEGELNDAGFVPWADVDAESRFSFDPNGIGGSITMSAPVIDILSGSWVSTIGYYNGGQAGDIEISASESLNISGDEEWNAVINSEAAFGAVSGNINLVAPDIVFSHAYVLSDVSFSEADAGSINVTADNSIVVDNYSNLAALTYYGGLGGQIRLTAPDVTVQNFAHINTDTFGDAGDAGTIYIDANSLLVAEGGLIDANSCSCAFGGAGSIFIDARTVTIQGTGFINVPTGIRSLAYGSGDSGDINIVADQIYMYDNGQIQAVSLTTRQDFIDNGEPDRIPGDSGSISIVADEIWMYDSFIDTWAVEAAGGNLDLNIAGMLFMKDSFINAEAGGVDEFSNGGNINLSFPKFVILDRSDIVASANAGNGGNIAINTDAIIVGPFSDIDASSRLGVDGEVVVESPNRLVSSVTPLEAPVLDVSEFNEDPCEVNVDRDRSSFTVPGSGGVMAAPGDYQPSPITAYSGRLDLDEQARNAEPGACEVTAP